MKSLELRQRRGSTLTVGDALDFLRRRRWICIGTIVAVTVASVLLAYTLPPVYRSEATILIEHATIPSDWIPVLDRSFIDEQIQVVSQRVMTKENIESLIEEFDLYAALRKSEPIEFVIETFRADVALERQTADIFDPRRGRMSGSTYAFVIAYHYFDPIKTQQITNRLSAIYLDENSRSRREQASEATIFLEQESEILERDIAGIEKSLADFKDMHADALPAQLMMNMQMLDRRVREQLDNRQELIIQRSQRDLYKGELSMISPRVTLLTDSGQTIASAGDRLAMLRQDYLLLTGKYGPEHPDVLRVKREIQMLSQGDNVDLTADINQRVASLVEQRDAMLDRYSLQHPDVVRLDRAIVALQEERGRAGSNRPAQYVRVPNNPQYLSKQRQITALVETIRVGEARRTQLRKEIDKIERNISIAPRVEQDWLALNRGYEAARSEFNGVTQRISQAKLSERLAQENKGQRFTLLENARLPVTPIEPNRVSIIFLGVILAIGAGIGLAALVDSLDTTIRGVHDLSQLLGIRPTATIPYLVTVRELHIRRVQKGSAFAGVALAVMFLAFSLS